MRLRHDRMSLMSSRSRNLEEHSRGSCCLRRTCKRSQGGKSLRTALICFVRYSISAETSLFGWLDLKWETYNKHGTGVADFPTCGSITLIGTRLTAKIVIGWGRFSGGKSSHDSEQGRDKLHDSRVGSQ